MTSAAVPAVRRLVAGCAAAVALAALAGCGSSKPPPPPPPTVLQAALSAASGVNPDGRGRASPVVVRVFELKTLAAFEGADFFSLWDREKETLGADLVAREELQLRPGEQRSLERTLAPETRHVGVIAAYRDLERAKWRVAYGVVAHRTQAVTVLLDARSVSITAK